jgi:hopene-associated glycosyltransferase HpnB
MGIHWWELAPWVVLAAWIYLVLAHGRFWSTDLRLSPAAEPEHWPRVAVIVPARNEAEMIAETLPGLVAQDYPGEVAVVLVDDASTDGTAEVAGRVGGGGRIPLSVVAGTERPDGWAGKLWALHQGVTHATGPEPPEWLLLTDADIAHPPDSLRRLVAAAIEDERDMVSLMARLRMVTAWERLLIPAFVYFFAQLYPFRRVGRPGGSAAAAGGCILVRASALSAAGGIASIRGAVIDDVALARRLKGSGSSIWLGLAEDMRSVRPYPKLGDLWAMVTRSAFTQLRCSAVLLVGTLVGLGVVYLGPLISLLAGLGVLNGWLIAPGALSWALMAATYLPMVRYYGLRPGWALTLPAAAVLYGAMTADSARRHWRRGGVEWKGRRYRQ